MKIIDLLNKIANGEELPKKIKYEKHIYEYAEGTYDWAYYIQNNGTMKFLLTDVFNSNDNVLNILNNEIEIIEEPMKIEKLDLTSMYSSIVVRAIDIELQYKLNEIIDYINKEHPND